MKLLNKIWVVLFVGYFACSSAVSVGHEVAGITLDVWWKWADLFQTSLVAYCVGYPVGAIGSVALRRYKVRRSKNHPVLRLGR